MSFAWNRPTFYHSDVPYENIWLKFNVKDLGSNHIASYKIQNLQEHRFDDAVNFFTEYYLGNEAIMSSKGVAANENSVRQLRDFWYFILSQKMSLICYRESSRDIVSISLVCVLTEDEYNERKFEFEAGPLKEVFDFNYFFYSRFNVLTDYGTDKYMTSYGTAISPNYRGRGIAAEMLRAQEPLARAFGIKLISAGFTSIDTQIPAYKVGFTTHYEMPFDYAERNGHPFPGIKSKSIKQMSKWVG